MALEFIPRSEEFYLPDEEDPIARHRRWLEENQYLVPDSTRGKEKWPDITSPEGLAELIRPSTAIASFAGGPAGVAAGLADVQASATQEQRDPAGWEYGLAGLGAVPLVGGAVRKLPIGQIVKKLANMSNMTPEELGPILQRLNIDPTTLANKSSQEIGQILRNKIDETGFGRTIGQAPQTLPGVAGPPLSADEVANAYQRLGIDWKETRGKNWAEVSDYVRYREAQGRLGSEIENIPPSVGRQAEMLSKEGRGVAGQAPLSEPAPGLRPSVPEGVRQFNQDILGEAQRAAQGARISQTAEAGRALPEGGLVSSLEDMAAGREPNPRQALMETLKNLPVNASVFGLEKLSRALMLTLDLGSIGIQAWYSAYNHPREFANAAWLGIKGAANPKWRAERAFQMKDEIYEAANDGIVFFGPEYRAASGPRGAPIDPEGVVPGVFENLPGALTNIPVLGGGLAGGSRSVKFANDFFRGHGDELRLQVYRGLKDAVKPADEMQTRQLAEWVNNITGTSADNLVALEREILFAPRYYRGLIKTALGGTFEGGPKAQLGNVPIWDAPAAAIGSGRWGLMKMGGIAALLTTAINELRGEETSYDPTDPNFLRIRNVFGQDLSLLGPYDVFFRIPGLLMTRGVGDTGEYLLQTRTRPLISGVSDIIKGKTFSGESLDPAEVGWPSVIGNFAKSRFAPISAQNLIENVSRAGDDPGRLIDAAVALPMGISGLRQSPLSRTDLLEMQMKKEGIQSIKTGEQARKIDELSRGQRKGLEEGELKKQLDLLPDYRSRAVRDYDLTRESLIAEQEKADELLRKSWKGEPSKMPLSASQWNEDRKGRMGKLEGARTLLERTDRDYAEKIRQSKENPKDKFEKALSDYYGLRDQYKVEGQGRLPDSYFENLDKYLSDLEPNVREFVEDSIGINRTALEKERQTEVLKLKPYWKIRDDLENTNRYRRVVEKVNSLAPGTDQRRKAEQDPAWLQFQRELNIKEDNYLNSHRSLAAILKKWYGRVPPWERQQRGGRF